MVKGKAWLGIKDPPAGEGQVGLKTIEAAASLIINRYYISLQE